MPEGGAVGGADAHAGPRVGDAAGREAGRPLPRQARRWPSICRSMRSTRSRRRLTPVLWRRLPGRGRLSRELARRAAWSAPRSAPSRPRWPKARIERTALILVGRVLQARDFRDSALYDAAYHRRFRGRGRSEHVIPRTSRRCPTSRPARSGWRAQGPAIRACSRCWRCTPSARPTTSSTTR